MFSKDQVYMLLILLYQGLLILFEYLEVISLGSFISAMTENDYKIYSKQ